MYIRFYKMEQIISRQYVNFNMRYENIFRKLITSHKHGSLSSSMSIKNVENALCKHCSDAVVLPWPVPAYTTTHSLTHFNSFSSSANQSLASINFLALQFVLYLCVGVPIYSLHSSTIRVITSVICVPSQSTNYW